MTAQKFKGSIFFPRCPLVGTAGNVAYSVLSTLTATTHRAAQIFQLPKAGNVRKLGVRIGTVSGAVTLDVRLETVDTTTGNPTGTLVGTTTNGTLTNPTSASFNLVTMTADAAVTASQPVAIVINPTAIVTSCQVNSFTTEGGNPKDFPYVSSYNGTTWTKATKAPVISIEYDDGSYGEVAGVWPASALSTTTITSATTPDCAGIRFQVPFGCTANGAWVYLNCSAADANFNINLYDSDGVSPLATIDWIGTVGVYAGATIFFIKFLSDATLLPATTYRLAVEGASTGNVIVQYFDVSTAPQMDTVPGGQAVYATTAKDPSGTGSWTDTTTRRYLLGLMINSFDVTITTTPGADLYALLG
jgi:hypothetical protein